MCSLFAATFWGKVLVLEQEAKGNPVLPPDDPIFEGMRDRLVCFSCTPIPPPATGDKRFGVFLLVSKSCAASYVNSLHGITGWLAASFMGYNNYELGVVNDQ